MHACMRGMGQACLHARRVKVFWGEGSRATLSLYVSRAFCTERNPFVRSTQFVRTQNAHGWGHTAEGQIPSSPSEKRRTVAGSRPISDISQL